MFWGFLRLWRGAPALGGDLFFSPSLHARIEALLDPFEGRVVSAAVLGELQSHAQRVFEDAVTGLGLLPGEWRVEVTCDELLGPVSAMVGPEQQCLHVADFEQRLRLRELELPLV